MKKKEPFRTFPGCYEGTGWLITEPLSKRKIKKVDQGFYKDPIKYIKNPHQSTDFNKINRQFDKFCIHLDKFNVEELQEIDRYCEQRIMLLCDSENRKSNMTAFFFAFMATAISVIIACVSQFAELAPWKGIIMTLLIIEVLLCGVNFLVIPISTRIHLLKKAKLLLFHSAVKDVLAVIALHAAEGEEEHCCPPM